MSQPSLHTWRLSRPRSSVQGIQVPRAGTISNFTFDGVNGGNSGVVITLFVQGVATAVTCTTGTGYCQDLTHTATIPFNGSLWVKVGGNVGVPAFWSALLQ